MAQSIIATTICFLILAGGSMRPAVTAPIPLDAPERAKSSAYTMVQAFPAYLADPISRYEQPEILNVSHDIAAIKTRPTKRSSWKT
jgi:hypothetical protein